MYHPNSTILTVALFSSPFFSAHRIFRAIPFLETLLIRSSFFLFFYLLRSVWISQFNTCHRQLHSKCKTWLQFLINFSLIILICASLHIKDRNRKKEMRVEHFNMNFLFDFRSSCWFFFFNFYIFFCMIQRHNENHRWRQTDSSFEMRIWYFLIKMLFIRVTTPHFLPHLLILTDFFFFVHNNQTVYFYFK